MYTRDVVAHADPWNRIERGIAAGRFWSLIHWLSNTERPRDRLLDQHPSLDPRMDSRRYPRLVCLTMMRRTRVGATYMISQVHHLQERRCHVDRQLSPVSLDNGFGSDRTVSIM